MDITARAVHPRRLDFGALELVARNATGAPQSRGRSRSRGAVRPRVWQLERLRLSMPCGGTAGERAMGRANVADLQAGHQAMQAAFLNRLQLKDVVKGGKPARSPANCAGADRRSRWTCRRSRGTMDIAMRDGQFLKVEPGAAKLIGVLNLQALPKLLTLDFRDIFEQGFAFDELRGSVAILDGIARTDSLAMRGLQAVVQIKGQADLDGEHAGPQSGGRSGTQRRARRRLPMRRSSIRPSGWVPFSRSRFSASRCRGRWRTKSRSPAPGRIRRWWSASASASAHPRGNRVAAFGESGIIGKCKSKSQQSRWCRRPRWPRTWPRPSA